MHRADDNTQKVLLFSVQIVHTDHHEDLCLLDGSRLSAAQLHRRQPQQEAVRGAACNTESVRNIIGGQYLVLAHSRLPLGETWTAADDIAYAQRFE